MARERPEVKENRMTINFNADLYAGLSEMAEDRNTTLSELIREILTGYLMDHLWASTIGETAKKAISAGKTNEDTLDIVRRKFPKAGTTLSSISWYRSKLRREDPNVPSDFQARNKAT